MRNRGGAARWRGGLATDFNRWAERYDRHWAQRLFFDRIHRAVLALAGASGPAPARVLDVGCGTGRLLEQAAARWPGAELVGVDPAGGEVVARGEQLARAEQRADVIRAERRLRARAGTGRGLRLLHRVGR
jgi:ubiquinone/menaquinone biosynthesis C-methylase UbiE